jgi:hypothetical protein
MSDLSSVRTDLTGVPATLATAASTKSGGTATFTINGVDTVAQVARDLTIGVGDTCLIQRVGAVWVAVQRLYTAAPTAPDTNPPIPTPKPTVVTGTLVVPAIETRSRQGSRWRSDNDDIYQGEYGSNGNHTGCAFYGSKPRSLSGATVTSATVKMRRRSAGGITADQPVTLRLVTQSTRPSGAPTLGSSTSGPNLRWGESTTFTIPDSWAQAMVDGTAGGLAVFESDGDPYLILDGRGRYSSSFTMTIKWQR